METLGEMLKRVREGRGLTLDDLYNRTRIHKAYIEALEEDRYEVFPAPTYVVGFLGAYARALGLDPEEVLRRYHSDQEIEEPKEEKLWTDEPEEPAKKSRWPYLLMVPALLLLAAAAYFWFGR